MWRQKICLYCLTDRLDLLCPLPNLSSLEICMSPYAPSIQQHPVKGTGCQKYLNVSVALQTRLCAQAVCCYTVLFTGEIAYLQESYLVKIWSKLLFIVQFAKTGTKALLMHHVWQKKHAQIHDKTYKNISTTRRSLHVQKNLHGSLEADNEVLLKCK